MKRRHFIKRSTRGFIGAGLIGMDRLLKPDEKQEIHQTKIREYRTLGRTGFRVSDIAFGAPKAENVISAALDRGVNYLDTGENYTNGNGERCIGRAIKGRDRKSIFITTKLMLKNNLNKESILHRARKCLERLNTDYIDCLMIHNATDVKIIGCEGFHSAADQLKSEGRLRFIGITSHGTTWWKNDHTLMKETMERVCHAAAEDGRFDVFLFIYNFLNTKLGEQILRTCKEKNIGTTLMKINPVHNYSLLQKEFDEMIREGKEITPRDRQVQKEFETILDQAQDFMKKHNLSNLKDVSAAALRFVLKHPGVHTVCCQMPNFDEMEHWISLSGGTLSSHDEQRLGVFKEGLGRFYCRHACGLCEEKCPRHVPINTIMRYHHYFSVQRREKFAMTKYDRLPTVKADACTQCDGLCEAACPYGVPIHGLLKLANWKLTLV